MKTSEFFPVAQPDGIQFSGFAYPGSLVLMPGGSLLATFTGHKLRGPHQAVGAYSDDGGRTWSAVTTLFGGDLIGDSSSDLGESYGDPNVVVVDERRVMVFCVSLRYDEKVWDLSRTRFWRRISEDGGRSFGPVEELPRHKKYYVGTVSPGLRLRDGSLVMGYSWDRAAEEGRPAEGEGGMDFVSGVLISRDEGESWLPGGDCQVETEKAPDALAHATMGLDEPAIAELPTGGLFMLGRTGTHNLWQSRSDDGGLTWEPPVASPLTSHNCPAALLSLANGDVVVAYNDHPQRRINLSVRLSRDGCRTWGPSLRIFPIGDYPVDTEAAYPNLCRLSDGTIVVVFYQVAQKKGGRSQSISVVRFLPEEFGTS